MREPLPRPAVRIERLVDLLTVRGGRSEDELKAFDDFQNLIPLGQRRGQPEEVAAGFKFLFSRGASFVNGITLFVDGGHDTTLRPDVREFGA